MKISGENFLNQFEIAKGNSLEYDFTASEKHLAYTIYNAKTLYTQIYDVNGNIYGDECLIKDIPAHVDVASINMDMLSETNSVVLWSELDTTTEEHSLKAQVIDINSCDKLPEDVLIATHKTSKDVEMLESIMAYQKSSTFDLFTYDKDVVNCTTSLCKESFDKAGQRIVDSIVSFDLPDSVRIIKIAAFNSTDPKTDYILERFIDGIVLGSREINANIMDRNGKVSYSHIITDSAGDELKEAKESAVVSVGSESFWTCIKEGHAEAGQIECVQSENGNLTSVMNSVVPFKFFDAKKPQGNFAIKTLQNDDGIYARCIDFNKNDTTTTFKTEPVTTPITTPITTAKTTSQFVTSTIANHTTTETHHTQTVANHTVTEIPYTSTEPNNSTHNTTEHHPHNNGASHCAEIIAAVSLLATTMCHQIFAV